MLTFPFEIIWIIMIVIRSIRYSLLVRNFYGEEKFYGNFMDFE